MMLLKNVLDGNSVNISANFSPRGATQAANCVDGGAVVVERVADSVDE